MELKKIEWKLVTVWKLVAEQLHNATEYYSCVVLQLHTSAIFRPAHGRSTGWLKNGKPFLHYSVTSEEADVPGENRHKHGFKLHCAVVKKNAQKNAQNTFLTLAVQFRNWAQHFLNASFDNSPLSTFTILSQYRNVCTKAVKKNSTHFSLLWASEMLNVDYNKYVKIK